MLSQLWGVRLAVLIAATASLGACRTFSPDGGMDMVAAVAATGLNKDVIQVRSAEDAAAVQTKVTRLLHRPLSADVAVQIALLNNLGLQAAYNRLGIAEALAVKASRPPALSFSFSDVSTPVELDIERQIIGSLLNLVTMPARTRIASDQFAAAELRAAEETLRVAAETRRAYLRAVAAREIVAALGEAKANAEASAELAGHLKQTGAVNKLDQARREVFATETDAELVNVRQQATAAREKLTRLMGLWHTDLDAYLPSALPQLPASTRSVRAIEQDALNARVDVQMARLEMEAMAKSYGLTRETHFLNVLDATGVSKMQKDKGEKRAEGGGYELVLEVPLFDFGKANVQEAEQRYLEAANRLGQLGVNAASEAREAYGAYRATYAVAIKYESEVLPLHQTISAETELQYNAMQIDAFALLQAAREQLTARVAGIEAKRNFWLASTDLSVAMLGGGAIASEPDAVIATTSSSTNAEYIWTLNARVFPAIDVMPVRLNDRVRIRMGNLTMTAHPMHVHGHHFAVSCTDGGWVPETAQFPEATTDVPVGAVRAIDFVADAPGDWAFHCHKSHHTMNAMGHNVVNLIGAPERALAKAVKRAAPNAMAMGTDGMGMMAEMEMPLPDNTLPMMTGSGQFGPIEMGGMFTVMKVREGLGANDYKDPGPYKNPSGTVAYEVNVAEAGEPARQPGAGEASGTKMPGMDMPGMEMPGMEMPSIKPRGPHQN